jgi:glycosyltransferase involved in cell wall biosynthesis
MPASILSGDEAGGPFRCLPRKAEAAMALSIPAAATYRGLRDAITLDRPAGRLVRRGRAHAPPVAPRAHVGRRLALLLTDLGSGGVQHMTLRLAGGLADRGCQVDLVLYRNGGPLVDRIPTGVRVVELDAPSALGRFYPFLADPGGFQLLFRFMGCSRKSPRTVDFLPALVRYLRRERPDALLAATSDPNLEAIWARQLAGTATRVLVSERMHMSMSLADQGKRRSRALPALVGRTYPRADAIVAVSDGVADELARCTGIPRARIRTVYNPVVGADLEGRLRRPVDHPWFVSGAPPVVLSVGRLSAQKDHPTLIRAFTRVRAEREARLVIFGDSIHAHKSGIM